MMEYYVVTKNYFSEIYIYFRNIYVWGVVRLKKQVKMQFLQYDSIENNH